MPKYIYTAKNAAGVETNGYITANSKKEALDAIHRLKLFPVSVEDSEKGNIKLQFFKRRVPDIQISAALLQLADLLENGVPVLQAFQILEKQTQNVRLRNVFKDIHNRISEGEAVDSAFSVHSDIFDELTINIIHAGAEGAFLEDALRRVGSFLEQEIELRGKVFGAMAYPMAILSIGAIFVVVALLFIIPQFAEIFEMAEESGEPLPMPTQSLFFLRDTLLAHGLYVVGGCVLLVFWLKAQLATKLGRRIWDRCMISLPLLGRLLLDGAIARFCRVFGTLLANGVPILRALEISGQSTGNSLLGDAVGRSVESVSSGEPLSKPLAEAGIIPIQVMAMITIAEESNTLETVLVNTANSIERQIARELTVLVGLLQPVVLLIVGSMLFYIILALILPLASVNFTM